jgi:putative spermidine/putrescine transport system ATP-binding protein
LQRDLGITFVYVTHDQEEALTMSDRLAVFNEGRIEQVGSPADVYERPQTEFVAGFVGVSNVLERGGRRITIRPEKIHMTEDGPGRRLDGARPGAEASALPMPERGSGEPAVVREVVFVDLDSGGELVVVRQNLELSSDEVQAARGRHVRLAWKPEHTYELPKEGTGQ